jgi:hypothetical protein
MLSASRRIALLSVVAVIPCFWQRRIQAGDLSSHIYNSWLAQQIELGKAPGLVIAPMSTNVMFDLMLGWLFRVAGPEPAQRIAVSVAVLIFFWGAFAFISTSSGRRPWYLAPCLLMLTYGWVFHIGFFNFYLSVGLSLWAVTLSPRSEPIARIGAAVLLAAAYTGHVLGPIWAIAVIAYMGAARRLTPGLRFALLGLAMGSMGALRFWITSRYQTFGSFHQALEAGAVDQVWTFGLKYCAISIGLTLLWGFLLLGVSHRKGFMGTACDVSFQLCILMAFGILVFPTRIELPQYRMALTFISERMTLPYAVLLCAFLAATEPPKWLKIAFVPLAAVYFSFLYVDTRAINRVEQQMEALTASLSTNDRVFSALADPMSRVAPWAHNLDRVCLGRCLSYTNYEPFSQAFRVRAAHPNRFVVTSAVDYGALNDGGYIVKPGDLPLYQITLCDERKQDLCLRRLEAGVVTRNDLLLAVPLLW